jgi:hypothetical protein
MVPIPILFHNVQKLTWNRASICMFRFKPSILDFWLEDTDVGSCSENSKLWSYKPLGGNKDLFYCRRLFPNASRKIIALLFSKP